MVPFLFYWLTRQAGAEKHDSFHRMRANVVHERPCSGFIEPLIMQFTICLQQRQTPEAYDFSTQLLLIKTSSEQFTEMCLYGFPVKLPR